MNRPGRKDERGQGCCLFFFGIPFLGFGLIAALSMSRQTQPGGLIGQFLTLVFPLVFAAVGAGIMFGGWRKMRTGRWLAQPLTPLGSPSSWRESSCFPKLTPIRATARGRVRLPQNESPGGSFLLLLIIATIWNGLTWTILYFLISQVLATRESFGVGEGLAVAFVGLFCLVGLSLIYAVIKRLLAWLLVGKTWIELPQEPLTPGSAVAASLHQSGDFSIERTVVSLVCMEEADYGAGTNRTTAREEVFRELVLERANLRARHGESLLSWELRIPDDAIHSFCASSNRIRWFLEVKLVIPNRPDFDSKFEFRIAPVKGK